MNIRDIEASLDYLFEAQLTPFFWGHAGAGKSTVPRDYAKKKGWKFFPFYLGTQSDLGDVLGLAEFVTNEDGSKNTVFATPKWMADMIQYCEENPESGAIIFLDEFNRARRDIIAGMFSLALDKTFHTLKLPKNCHIIAAGNPPTDDYFVTDVDETALMGRFVHIKFEPTFEEWLGYAKEKGFESSLIEFFRNQPQLLTDNRKDFKLPVKVDGRAVERASKLFNVKTPMNLLEQLLQGIIGLERTVAYLQFLKEQDKPLTAAEVLTGKKTQLLDKWSSPTDIVASLLNLTCENVIEHLLKRGETKDMLDAKEKKNFMSFIKTIPKDIAYNLFVTLNNKRDLNAVYKDFETDPMYEDDLVNLALAAKGK